MISRNRLSKDLALLKMFAANRASCQLPIIAADISDVCEDQMGHMSSMRPYVLLAGHSIGGITCVIGSKMYRNVITDRMIRVIQL